MSTQLASETSGLVQCERNQGGKATLRRERKSPSGVSDGRLVEVVVHVVVGDRVDSALEGHTLATEKLVEADRVVLAEKVKHLVMEAPKIFTFALLSVLGICGWNRGALYYDSRRASGARCVERALDRLHDRLNAASGIGRKTSSQRWRRRRHLGCRHSVPHNSVPLGCVCSVSGAPVIGQNSRMRGGLNHRPSRREGRGPGSLAAA